MRVITILWLLLKIVIFIIANEACVNKNKNNYMARCVMTKQKGSV
jgi:hypothetical protein